MKYKEFVKKLKDVGIEAKLGNTTNNLYKKMPAEFIYNNRSMIARVSETQSGNVVVKETSFNKIPIERRKKILNIICGYAATLLGDRHLSAGSVWIIPLYERKLGKDVLLLGHPLDRHVSTWIDDLSIRTDGVLLSELKNKTQGVPEELIFSDIEILELEKDKEPWEVNFIENRKRLVIDDIQISNSTK